MSGVKHNKVVSSLPTPLEADSIYYVRVRGGFDIYITNTIGVIVAYPLNQQPPNTINTSLRSRDGGYNYSGFTINGKSIIRRFSDGVCEVATTTLENNFDQDWIDRESLTYESVT